MKGGRQGASLAAGCVAALTLAIGLPAVSAGRPAPAHAAGVCADPNVSTPRDPANPLALPATPPSGDPLQGAHFFVDGPAHGQAAGAIASLLGMNPMSFSDSDSWAAFKANHAGAIARNAKARQLVKIADQEETQNVSSFAHGGGYSGIFAQTQKLLCNNMSADPTQPTVPVLTTFIIYPNGQFCPRLSQIRGWQGTFKGDINGMAGAIGSKRAVILEDIDSIGASACLNGASLGLWLGDLKYESQQFSKLPHAVVYAEAGYSDAQAPGWTAARLWQAGINQVRGFYTNGTHFAWSIDEIRWAQDVADNLSGLSHGRYHAHFVINTAQNGQGPKRNANIVTQGIENLCNPPGRGLGRKPTGNVAPTFDRRTFKGLDGFLWTGVPGRSHNSNCPNGPWQSGGVFDPRFALELAQHANQRLGPGYPSQPY